MYQSKVLPLLPEWLPHLHALHMMPAGTSTNPSTPMLIVEKWMCSSEDPRCVWGWVGGMKKMKTHMGGFSLWGSKSPLKRTSHSFQRHKHLASWPARPAEQRGPFAGVPRPSRAPSMCPDHIYNEHSALHEPNAGRAAPVLPKAALTTHTGGRGPFPKEALPEGLLPAGHRRLFGGQGLVLHGRATSLPSARLGAAAPAR